MNRTGRSTRVIALLAAIMVGVGLCAWPPRARGQSPATTGGNPSAAGTSSVAEVREIRITAKKFEFVPSRITVKKGERVKLLITAVDHDHGFKLDGFDVNQLIKKGATATIELTPDKTGTLPFHCSHFCGLGHPKMHGELVVEESADSTAK